MAGSIFAATQMRNFASHASPWQRHPSENRATLSLVLLVCYIGYLFPKRSLIDPTLQPGDDASAEWWHENARRVGGMDVLRNAVSQALSDADEALAIPIIQETIRRSSPRGLCSLIDRAVSEGWIDVTPCLLRVRVCIRAGKRRFRPCEERRRPYHQIGAGRNAASACTSVADSSSARCGCNHVPYKQKSEQPRSLPVYVPPS